jgi:hypothetical protein
LARGEVRQPDYEPSGVCLENSMKRGNMNVALSPQNHLHCRGVEQVMTLTFAVDSLGGLDSSDASESSAYCRSTSLAGPSCR